MVCCIGIFCFLIVIWVKIDKKNKAIVIENSDRIKWLVNLNQMTNFRIIKSKYYNEYDCNSKRHIIPVAKGGLTVECNLRTLCERCNLGKSDKL